MTTRLESTLSQFEPYVSRIRETRKETERVIQYSQDRSPSGSTILRLVRGIITIRRRWHALANEQSKLIEKITEFDFTKVKPDDLRELAEMIEGGVANGRELLVDAYGLGAEIRFWWRDPLQRFSDQIEHFDSIAESLRLECDPEATILLARAVSCVATDHQTR